MKAKDIAGKVGVKLNTVRNIIHYYKIRNLNLNMPDKEREEPWNKKITIEVLQFISETVIAFALKHQVVTYGILRENIFERFNIEVSSKTVGKACRELFNFRFVKVSA